MKSWSRKSIEDFEGRDFAMRRILVFDIPHVWSLRLEDQDGLEHETLLDEATGNQPTQPGQTICTTLHAKHWIAQRR